MRRRTPQKLRRDGVFFDLDSDEGKPVNRAGPLSEKPEAARNDSVTEDLAGLVYRFEDAAGVIRPDTRFASPPYPWPWDPEE